MSSIPGFAEEEARLKAAFIYNFTKYVTWPQYIEQAGGALHVCVLGADAYFDELNQLAGRDVRSFKLEIKQLKLSDPVDSCQVVYTSGASVRKFLPQTGTLPILTISDEPGFVDAGGMIGLVTEGRRIRFDINLGRARDVQLQISSRLLQLARRVE
ncbi:YfiR family protein [Ketobacter sp.]|uniref:YfiR family protein n=1 Tax=Ketobacter sp. TaxID=2083498 RepID=UPI000F28B862|nr:YfiR family protein [Ketobacter sp.]RLT92117.1 MAG: YfiR family protein [Ketobacter sp.]